MASFNVSILFETPPKAVGVDLILSGFLHFIEEVEYFGAKVLPLVRELEAQQQSVETAKSA